MWGTWLELKSTGMKLSENRDDYPRLHSLGKLTLHQGSSTPVLKVQCPGDIHQFNPLKPVYCHNIRR